MLTSSQIEYESKSYTVEENLPPNSITQVLTRELLAAEYTGWPSYTTYRLRLTKKKRRSDCIKRVKKMAAKSRKYNRMRKK